MWLDVDSALAEVPVNVVPLVDAATGKVIDEGVTYDEAGMDLIWHFVTTAGATSATAVTPTTGGVHDWAHQDGGMYTIEIPASGGTVNNDTEGFGYFTGNTTANLPWRGPTIGFRAAALNNLLIDSAFSATRGLAGTALPDAVADAAGGLPISDAGGLDMDAILEDTATTIPGLISGIGTSGGAAISVDATDDNEDGGIAGVTVATTKVGTQTNTFSSTSVLDGTAHILTHSGQVVDHVYQFLGGGGTSPVGLTWTGYSQPNNATLTFQVWNHVGGTWETVATKSGLSGTTNVVKNIVLYARHMGTSAAELGKVYLRLLANSAHNHVIGTDQVYFDKSVTSRTVGYADGSVWVDTNNGTAGTESFVNGTADNPVLTWADAQTIATAVGLNSFRFIAGSTVTLDASAANKRFIGSATIALGSQDITRALFRDAYSITGISSGEDARFENCGIGTASASHSYFTGCRFSGTFTMLTGTSKDFFFINCTDAAASGASGNATFVYVADANGMFRDWRGGIQLNNHKATNDTLLDGAGRLIIEGTSTAGGITIRGHFPPANNAATFIGTGGTITQTQRYGSDVINTECDTALSDYGAPTHTEMTTAFTEIKGATWAATDTLEAIRDRGDTAWITATGFNTTVPDAAGTMATFIGANGANLTDLVTATGFSTHDAAAVVTALGTGSTLTDCLTATGFSTHDAAAVVTALGTGSTLTDCLTATGFSTLDAAGVRTAVGLDSANLDTQLSGLSDYVDCLPPTLDGSTFTSLPAVTTDSASRTASQADVSDIPAEVWAYGTRTLTSFGTLVADIATAVWEATTRTLSAFGFTVTTDSASREASKADVSDLALTTDVTSAHTTTDAAIAAIATDVDKIPRLGETMRHRQVASDSDAQSADVIIEEAG